MKNGQSQLNTTHTHKIHSFSTGRIESISKELNFIKSISRPTVEHTKWLYFRKIYQAQTQQVRSS